jgi:hypothetical protein
MFAIAIVSCLLIYAAFTAACCLEIVYAPAYLKFMENFVNKATLIGIPNAANLWQFSDVETGSVEPSAVGYTVEATELKYLPGATKVMIDPLPGNGKWRAVIILAHPMESLTGFAENQGSKFEITCDPKSHAPF